MVEMKHETLLNRILKCLNLNRTELFCCLDIMSADAGVTSEEVMSEMLMKRVKQEVMEKVSPYLRGSGPFIKYCPSSNRYKVRIPNALVDTTPPATGRTENELWVRVHEYLFGNRPNTLTDIYNVWTKMRDSNPDVADTTKNRDALVWRKFLEGTDIATMPVEDIKASMVMALFERISHGEFYVFERMAGVGYRTNPAKPYRYKDRNGGDKCTQAVTRKELINIKSLLNTLMNEAVIQDLVPANVVREVSTRKIRCKTVNKSDEVYTEVQREAVIRYCLNEKRGNIYFLAIAMMFCFNMRIGELKALQWEDVSGERIHVWRELVLRKDDDGRLVPTLVAHTKNIEHGDRWQYITPLAAHILSVARGLCGSEGFILKNNAGGPISGAYFNLCLKKVCKDLSIRYYPSHKIRFSAISRFVANGADIQSAALMSGHTDNKTTMHYVRHVQAEEDVKKYWEATYNGSPTLMRSLGIA